MTAGVPKPLCEFWCTTSEVDAVSGAASGASPWALNLAVSVASYALFQLSGRQYPGLCTSDWIRPVARRTTDGEPAYVGQLPAPIFSGWDATWGTLVPWGWCRCGAPREGDCTCNGPHRISLGVTNIDSVLGVQIDGQTLDPSGYELQDRRWLVRMADAHDGRQTWPCCQRMDLPLGDVGTFGVRVTYGMRPPDAGRLAAMWLARDIATGLTGGTCVTPANVVAEVRQGITRTFAKTSDVLKTGWLAIPAVDLFLAAERIGRRRRPASVLSVDIGKPVHRKVGVDGS